MSVKKILNQHFKGIFNDKGERACQCGFYLGNHGNMSKRHKKHAIEVLEQHMQEREAAVIESLADELGEYQNSHDVAECAAHVEGEVGRQACIDRWLEITEDPESWLREKSREHHANGFEYLRYVAFEAWQEGEEAGCENGRNSLMMENGWLDKFDLIENPYADKESSDGR